MNEYKEVYYCAYCYKCKHFDSDDIEDPCNRCLIEFTNVHSHKPINFAPKEGYNDDGSRKCSNSRK